MMWFVRKEFLLGFRSQRRLADHLSLRGSAAGFFCFQLHPARGGKRVPRGVKGCRCDPRRDYAKILKLRVQMHVWGSTKMPIHSCVTRNSQLRHSCWFPRRESSQHARKQFLARAPSALSRRQINW
ncbi:hypothetical protein TNCV_2464531 [Trichonephila clavipes]|nr:hypothetical protein TNCV_2464531 [Trichonephila clavipes]